MVYSKRIHDTIEKYMFFFLGSNTANYNVLNPCELCTTSYLCTSSIRKWACKNGEKLEGTCCMPITL